MLWIIFWQVFIDANWKEDEVSRFPFETIKLRLKYQSNLLEFSVNRE